MARAGTDHTSQARPGRVRAGETRPIPDPPDPPPGTPPTPDPDAPQPPTEAEIEGLRTEVDELCQAATEANIELQRELAE